MGYPAVQGENAKETSGPGDTVDGQNPAPPRMMIIPLFIGFLPSQVVQDFVRQQYEIFCFFPISII